MKTLAELREYFKGDLFAEMLGISIDEAGGGRAVCSVDILPEHCNALGRAQGGFIFTLADFAFAVAANSEGNPTVTLNSTIHFLRVHKGNRLIATVEPIHSGRRTCVYQVTVTDNTGLQVAAASVSGCRGMEIPPAKGI